MNIAAKMWWHKYVPFYYQLTKLETSKEKEKHESIPYEGTSAGGTISFIPIAHDGLFDVVDLCWCRKIFLVSLRFAPCTRAGSWHGQWFWRHALPYPLCAQRSGTRLGGGDACACGFRLALLNFSK
jgi:hypothetical protein